MAAYIVRRLLWFIPVLLAVGFVTFMIARMTPGGPFDRDPTRRQITASTEQILRAKFGMDLPVWHQFTRYMFFDIETDPKTGGNKIVWGALGGNLGPTYQSRGAQTVRITSSEVSRGSQAASAIRHAWASKRSFLRWCWASRLVCWRR